MGNREFLFVRIMMEPVLYSGRPLQARQKILGQKLFSEKWPGALPAPARDAYQQVKAETQLASMKENEGG